MPVNLLSFFVGLPLWATAMIFAVLMLAIPTGRKILEGRFYNVALSSKVGEPLLFLVALVGIIILQSGRAIHVLSWLNDGWVQTNLLLGSFLVGVIVCIKTLGKREGRLMDIYHDVIVSPILLYLAITLLPVIFMNGLTVSKVATIVVTLIWIDFVRLDFLDEHMNQRKYLRKKGILLRG